MVPRHLHPEVKKVFISPGHYQQAKTKKADKLSSSRSSKHSFSFGLNTKNNPRGVYLADDELMYWDNHLKIPEEQSTCIELTVGSSVQHKSLLSLPSLENAGCVDSSLNQWVQWQTAPLASKFVHNSARSIKMKSVLEFTDELQMAPELSEACDCEMMDCFNYSDVHREEESVDGSEVVSEGKNDIAYGRKPFRRRLEDSSDEDEDFKTLYPKKKIIASLSNMEGGSASHNMPLSHPPNQTDDHSTPTNVSPLGDNDLTPPLSQSIVPVAPNLSAIAWLDDISLDVSSRFSSTQTPSCLQSHDKSTHQSCSLAKRHLLREKSFNPSEPLTAKKVKQNNSRVPWKADLLDQNALSNSLTQDSCSKTSTARTVCLNVPSTTLLNSLHSEAFLGSNCKSRGSLESSLIPESPIKEDNKVDCVHRQSLGDSKSSEESNSSLPCLLDRIACSPMVNEKSIEPPKSRINKNITCHFNPSHSTPSSSRTTLACSTPESEEKFLSNVRSYRKARHPFRQPDFLCSQIPSRPRNDVIQDDDFILQPLKRRAIGRQLPEQSPSEKSEDDVSSKEANLIIEEAELSGDSHSEDEKVDLTGCEYDYDDSFINDNSVLTQHITVNPNRARNVDISSSSKMGMYLRSLRSPDNLFSSKGTRKGNRYKLVLSQRYKLLKKYGRKAGLMVSPNVRRHKTKTTTRPTMETESEGSEAEEVMKVTDDAELNDSQIATEQHDVDYTSDNESGSESFDSGSVVDLNPPEPRTVNWRNEADNNLPIFIDIVSSSNSEEEREENVDDGEDCSSEEIALKIARLISENVIVSPSLKVNLLCNSFLGYTVHVNIFNGLIFSWGTLINNN